MNFIKNNSFIVSLIAFCALLTFFALVGEEDEEAVIVIHQGDTLWSLAAKYKGDIPHEQWIASVMDANNLHKPVIASGSKLVIPASLVNTEKFTDEIYLAGEEQ